MVFYCMVYCKLIVVVVVYIYPKLLLLPVVFWSSLGVVVPRIQHPLPQRAMQTEIAQALIWKVFLLDMESVMLNLWKGESPIQVSLYDLELDSGHHPTLYNLHESILIQCISSSIAMDSFPVFHLYHSSSVVYFPPKTNCICGIGS